MQESNVEEFHDENEMQNFLSNDLQLVIVFLIAVMLFVIIGVALYETLRNCFRDYLFGNSTRQQRQGRRYSMRISQAHFCGLGRQMLQLSNVMANDDSNVENGNRPSSVNIRSNYQRLLTPMDSTSTNPSFDYGSCSSPMSPKIPTPTTICQLNPNFMFCGLKKPNHHHQSANQKRLAFAHGFSQTTSEQTQSSTDQIQILSSSPRPKSKWQGRSKSINFLTEHKEVDDDEILSRVGNAYEKKLYLFKKAKAENDKRAALKRKLKARRRTIQTTDGNLTRGKMRLLMYSLRVTKSKSQSSLGQ